jgi:hypothetical protein
MYEVKETRMVQFIGWLVLGVFTVGAFGSILWVGFTILHCSHLDQVDKAEWRLKAMANLKEKRLEQLKDVYKDGVFICAIRQTEHVRYDHGRKNSSWSTLAIVQSLVDEREREDVVIPNSAHVREGDVFSLGVDREGRFILLRLLEPATANNVDGV